jgi:ELWxxDGT repeat protein
MHLQAAGQLVYFMASNGTHGRELWVSDGSETGTRLVKDIEPGIASSSSSELCAVGQKLIFAVTTRSGATELWISDGSSVGTQRLKVIHPSAGGKLRHTASFGSLVVFAAEDSTHGEEPWISDGTASGTMLLKECMPGSLGGSPTGFHDLGNGLCLFSALAGGAGRELWVTDGTSAGTTLLKDIRPGSRAGLAFSDTLCDGAVINSRLFFPADDGVNGWALWVSDGSAAGTQMLRAFRSDPRRDRVLARSTLPPVELGLAPKSRIWASNPGSRTAPRRARSDSGSRTLQDPATHGASHP